MSRKQWDQVWSAGIEFGISIAHPFLWYSTTWAQYPRLVRTTRGRSNVGCPDTIRWQAHHTIIVGDATTDLEAGVTTLRVWPVPSYSKPTNYGYEQRWTGSCPISTAFANVIFWLSVGNWPMKRTPLASLYERTHIPSISVVPSRKGLSGSFQNHVLHKWRGVLEVQAGRGHIRWIVPLLICPRPMGSDQDHLSTWGFALALLKSWISYRSAYRSLFLIDQVVQCLHRTETISVSDGLFPMAAFGKWIGMSLRRRLCMIVHRPSLYMLYLCESML